MTSSTYLMRVSSGCVDCAACVLEVQGSSVGVVLSGGNGHELELFGLGNWVGFGELTEAGSELMSGNIYRA